MTGFPNSESDTEFPEWDDDSLERPSELESAFLTLSMFGGLVLFGAGCLLIW